MLVKEVTFKNNLHCAKKMVKFLFSWLFISDETWDNSIVHPAYKLIASWGGWTIDLSMFHLVEILKTFLKNLKFLIFKDMRITFVSVLSLENKIHCSLSEKQWHFQAEPRRVENKSFLCSKWKLAIVTSWRDFPMNMGNWHKINPFPHT